MEIEVIISKPQLIQINGHRGQIDTDVDMVLVGFVGALQVDDMLYHGILTLTTPDDAIIYDKFSVSAILTEPPDTPKWGEL